MRQNAAFLVLLTNASVRLELGGNNTADLDIFNGSSSTANVAAHFLSNDGTNLAGATVPGSSPPVTYPGQGGTTTVTLAPQNTMVIPYQTGSGVRNSNPSTLLSTSPLRPTNRWLLVTTFRLALFRQLHAIYCLNREWWLFIFCWP